MWISKKIKDAIHWRWKRWQSKRIQRLGYILFTGNRVFITPNSHIIEIILETGDFEMEVRQLINQLVRPNSFFFDIGTNIGLISLSVLQIPKNINVLSFEPSPSVLPYLRQTISQAPYRNRWQLIEKAVGEKLGETYFEVNQALGKDGFDGIKNTGRGGNITQKIEVTMTTVDTEWALQNYPDVSVIKTDTEGYDFWVLVGAKKCIETCRPAIIIEWNFENLKAYDLPQAKIFEFCENQRYEIFSIFDFQRLTTLTELNVKFNLQQQENFLLLPTEWQGLLF